MSTTTLLSRLLRDARGSTAIMFGMAAVPLTLLAGGGLDFAQLNRAEQSLQNAIDAAALYGARTSLSDEAAADLAVRTYLQTRSEFPQAVIETSLTNNVLTVSAAAAVPTAFLGIMGIATIRIAADSGATMSGRGMELALVLDVSGSMGGWKVEALKESAQHLMATIYGEVQTLPGVRVAVAPFSGRVNIVDYGASWMEAGVAETSPGYLCTGLRSTANRETDAPPSVELFPEFTGDSETCPGPRAVGLTASRAVVDQAITDLYTGHGTSTHIGMAWGWRMLSPQWRGLWGDAGLPLAHHESPGKVVVIMTDGENHPNQSGDPLTTEQADAQLLRECAAMKAEGYMIYAVTFMMNGTLTALYQECATSPDHVHDTNSSEELMAAFDNIGGALSEGQLRLVF